MLDGLGADEIFCGYQRYRASYLRGGHASMINEMKFGKPTFPKIYLRRGQTLAPKPQQRRSMHRIKWCRDSVPFFGPKTCAKGVLRRLEQIPLSD